jgi:hypothetical protein
MARAGLVHRPADRLQHLPAPLGEDRGKPAFAGHPGRPLRTGPQPPIGRRRTKTRLELVQQLRLQNQRSRAVPAAQVAPSVQTLSLVARQPTLDPAPGLRHRGRNRGDGVPFGQKPDGLDGPRSRLCTSDTSLRALTRSDDPPPAPWLASATQGASADRRPRSPEIPPDFFNRKPYNLEHRIINRTHSQRPSGSSSIPVARRGRRCRRRPARAPRTFGLRPCAGAL